VICLAFARAEFPGRAVDDDVAGQARPATHPIREIEQLADATLAKLDSTFDAICLSPPP
jgi:hypothetical protein